MVNVLLACLVFCFILKFILFFHFWNRYKLCMIAMKWEGGGGGGYMSWQTVFKAKHAKKIIIYNIFHYVRVIFNFSMSQEHA